MKISLKAGDGGNGITAYRRKICLLWSSWWRRERCFMLDERIENFIRFQISRHFKAKKGEMVKVNMHGRNAEDLVLKVPPGTIIKSVESEECLQIWLKIANAYS